MHKFLKAICLSGLFFSATPLVGMEQSAPEINTESSLEELFLAKLAQGKKLFFENKPHEALTLFQEISNQASAEKLSPKAAHIVIEASFWLGVIFYSKKLYGFSKKCFDFVADYEGDERLRAAARVFLGFQYAFVRGVAQDFQHADCLFMQAYIGTNDPWVAAAVMQMWGYLCYFDPERKAGTDRVAQAQRFLEIAAGQHVNKQAMAESLCLLGYLYFHAAENKRGLVDMNPQQCGKKACDYFMQVLAHRDYSVAATERAEHFLAELALLEQNKK